MTIQSFDHIIVPPFCHHVFFWLRDPDNVAEREQFEKAASELMTIPEIRVAHLGSPAPIAKRPVVDDSYTYSLVLFFEDVKAHDAYQEHPAHRKFIADNKHLWTKVQIYDSQI